jgi:hypothetical protein
LWFLFAGTQPIGVGCLGPLRAAYGKDDGWLAFAKASARFELIVEKGKSQGIDEAMPSKSMKITASG